MTAASPTWYDVLEVDRTASSEEIRSAWKTAIADLDPTDRRFRLLNQAAEVLLDPAQRASYDRSLAPVPAPVPVPAPATHIELAGRQPTTATNPIVPGWLIAGLAFATLVFVGLSIWQAQQNQDEGTASGPSSSSGDATPDDARDAQAVAEKAILAISAYDYRDLDGSRAAAISYMTDEYRKKYDQLFAVIMENAPNTKTIVTTVGVASAVGLEGGGKVQVLLFFDRTRTNASTDGPEIFRDQATLTMKRVDGEWLVDDLTTTLPSS